MFRDAYNPKKLAQRPELLAWKSFSVPLLNDWLQFKKPIYLAYGTHDIASDLNDIVPLYFIRENNNKPFIDILAFLSSCERISNS